MTKEPYNMFGDPRSTLPGGTPYEDLLVLVKGIIHMNGGAVEVPEDFLMWVDREEAVRVDDVYKDGMNHKVFSITHRLPNQNQESHVTHTDPDGVVTKDVTLFAKTAMLYLLLSGLFMAVVLIREFVRLF